MTPTPTDLLKRARALFPAPIDIEKRVEQYRALLREHGYAEQEEAPCEGSSP